VDLQPNLVLSRCVVEAATKERPVCDGAQDLPTRVEGVSVTAVLRMLNGYGAVATVDLGNDPELMPVTHLFVSLRSDVVVPRQQCFRCTSPKFCKAA